MVLPQPLCYLLIMILFWAGKRLWVDMGKGDVLIALQISNQHSYLWFYQSNPVEDRISLDQDSVISFPEPIFIREL